MKMLVKVMVVTLVLTILVLAGIWNFARAETSSRSKPVATEPARWGGPVSPDYSAMAALWLYNKIFRESCDCYAQPPVDLLYWTRR